MKFSVIILGVFLLVLCSTFAQAKPLEESGLSSDDEMMETAEAQNPFLPRFAMRILKERRLRAQAQRRNNQGVQGPQRRTQPVHKAKCSTSREPIYKRDYYIRK